MTKSEKESEKKSKTESPQMLNIPHIPPEVLRIIAQHIPRSDLPNYRLVNKTFAAIGTETLFQAILFHCRSRSLARLDAIKKAENLSKYCHTLVWDANYWNISDVRDLHQWTRYFEAKACLPKHQPIAVGKKLSPEELINLANNRYEWERYLDNIYDEKSAKGWFNLECTLRGLSNVQKLHILNGHIERTHFGYKKTTDFISPPVTPIHYRGQSLYDDAGTDGLLERRLRSGRPGAHAFDAIRRFHNVGWQLTKLRLDAVCWSVFADEIGVVASLQQLLSLHLRITIRFEHYWGDKQYGEDETETLIRVFGAQDVFSEHHLMNFLVGLPKLQSLKLDFGCGEPSTAVLSDIFSASHTWPDLRKLTLASLITDCKDLLSLLHRHRLTLKTLQLHGVWFEPSLDELVCKVDPPDVLATIHKTLRLERAGLSGHFGQQDQSYDLDDTSLAHAVAEYLINGGTCPLNGTNSRKGWD
jgi:hypothetical protein